MDQPPDDGKTATIADEKKDTELFVSIQGHLQRLNISSRILFQLDTSRADQSFYSFSFIHQPGARALTAVVCLVHTKFRYIVLFRKQHPFMPILAHLLRLEHRTSCALWRFYKTNIFIFKLVYIISEMKI